eukprot:PhM_4_TR13248/c0_g1_i1/m.43976
MCTRHSAASSKNQQQQQQQQKEGAHPLPKFGVMDTSSAAAKPQLPPAQRLRTSHELRNVMSGDLSIAEMLHCHKCAWRPTLRSDDDDECASPTGRSLMMATMLNSFVYVVDNTETEAKEHAERMKVVDRTEVLLRCADAIPDTIECIPQALVCSTCSRMVRQVSASEDMHGIAGSRRANLSDMVSQSSQHNPTLGELHTEVSRLKAEVAAAEARLEQLVAGPADSHRALPPVCSNVALPMTSPFRTPHSSAVGVGAATRYVGDLDAALEDGPSWDTDVSVLVPGPQPSLESMLFPMEIRHSTTTGEPYVIVDNIPLLPQRTPEHALRLAFGSIAAVLASIGVGEPELISCGANSTIRGHAMHTDDGMTALAGVVLDATERQRLNAASSTSTSSRLPFRIQVPTDAADAYVNGFPIRSNKGSNNKSSAALAFLVADIRYLFMNTN